MIAKDLYVGIDAGGTHIRFRAIDTAGVVQAEGIIASAPDGGPEPLATLLAPLQDMTVVSLVAGITKISRTGVKDRWETYLRRLFPEAKKIQIVPDYVIALYGGLSESLLSGEDSKGAGVVVVAGTGSVIYGEDGRGNSLRVGGRGWEYGDEGSGAYLTTEIIRRTLHALDGLQELTPLGQAICAHLDTNEPSLLGERTRQRAPEEGRGFLLPLILAHAREGDAEAQRLFVGAGGWLAAYTGACIARLNLPECVLVIPAGGVWAAGSLLIEPFETVLHRRYPNARFLRAPGSGLQGAVHLALKDAIK